MEIISLEQILKTIPSIDLISEIEQGFIAYSEGRAIIPAIGEMILDKGEVHIKYGYIREDEFYVIKIASGFYENPKLGISSNNGLMLLFRQMTGELVCVLIDEGYLTVVRTAVAGAITAKYLAPAKVNKIGIVGTGTQARFQLLYLKNILTCRQVLVWGRGLKQLNHYKADMEKEGFIVEVTRDTEDIPKQCNLIVTTTPSKIPLIDNIALMKGTHITAIGSDTPEKQELNSMLLKNADIIVVDSIEQCLKRGEIFKAINSGLIREDMVMELGDIISGSVKGRTSEKQISIADLTGVAVQDIKIASAVFKAITSKTHLHNGKA